jgi:hypothetical protein
VGLLRRDQGPRGQLAELGIISAKGRNGTAELFKINTGSSDRRA